MKILLNLFFLFLLIGLEAQISHPRISPMSVIEQVVGLSTVKVVYSRPGVRGRTILGDIVPYGRIWRVGANESTKISTDQPLRINGNLLSPGTYSLYAFPNPESWEVVFHSNTGHWGDGRKEYNPEEDVFRIQVVPESIPQLQENFLITFDRIDHNSMDMIWQWEHFRITIPIEVDTDAAMMDEISHQIQTKPTAQTYYEAARYLQEQGKEPQQALSYLNKAIELGGDTYYCHRVKSLVEASLGDYENALESAKVSLKISEELGKDEFVRMNEKNISDWESKLKEKQ